MAFQGPTSQSLSLSVSLAGTAQQYASASAALTFSVADFFLAVLCDVALGCCWLLLVACTLMRLGRPALRTVRLADAAAKLCVTFTACTLSCRVCGVYSRLSSAKCALSCGAPLCAPNFARVL